MRIARLGEFNREKPAVIVSDTEAVFIDDVIADWNRVELEAGAYEKVAKLDLSSRPRVKISDFRLGSPVARPTKALCVGLNNDDVIVPPNSEKTDYEVEICVVMKKSALYLKSPAEAKDYILGYTVSQDVSERYWQVERGGQWVKGKSFPTFNPVGPWIVTPDEMPNPENLRLWCTVDGETRQDSNTNDMIFDISYCVWYISQVMELCAGDIINTGTPQGVGMGFKPARYLKGGEKVVTGIEGIGEITNYFKNYKG